MIISPVTASDDTILVGRIPAAEIILKVRKQYGIDASEYFRGLDTVSVRECAATGYRFFYPYRIAADDRFYRLLARNEHYYPESRWEFSKALGHIAPGDKVLEVGAGEGDFLQLLKERDIEATGLELNPEAVEAMRKKGLEASSRPVEEFSGQFPGHFDVVCFFQVLEHISGVRSFMEAALSCLKPGGKLLLAVPNNDSPVLKYDTESGDNLPPHHMGLWNRNSLGRMGTCFGLDLLEAANQPLPASYRGLYYRLMVRRRLGSLPGKVVVAATRWAAKRYLSGRLNDIPGPGIFMAYRKR